MLIGSYLNNLFICTNSIVFNAMSPHPNEGLASHKGRVTGFSADVSPCHPASVPYFCETQVMVKVIIVSSEENSSYCTTSTQLGCWANYLRFASSPAGYDVWKSGLSAKKLDWIYFCCTFNLCNLSENDLFIPEKFQVHPCPWNSLKYCRLLLKNLYWNYSYV